MKNMLLLLLFCITLVSAQPDLILQKTSFQPGETLIASIPAGNLLRPISSNDVHFFDEKRQVFFEYNLIFFEDNYYFYSYLTRQGNFTIKIDNILYRSPEPKSATIEKKFEVSPNFLENRTKTKIFSVKPGFVFSSGEAKIMLANKGTEALDINYDSEFISLSPDNFKEVIINPNETLSFFRVSTYANFTIPIIFIPLNSNASKLETKLRADPSYISTSVIENSESIKIIKLVNFANIAITNISASSDVPFVEIQTPQKVSAKSIENMALVINSYEKTFLKGSITINFTQSENNISEIKSLSIPVEIYVLSGNETPENPETSETCSQIGGKFCINQKCDAESIFTVDGYCCDGDCVDFEEPSGSGWLIGIVIFLVLIILGFLIYKKIKKTKPESTEKKLEEKSRLYEQRVSGKLTKE